MPRAWSSLEYLQGAPATGGAAVTGAPINGNGTDVDAQGAVGASVIEVQELAGGTATLTVQGSFDGTTWYSLGLQQTDATAAPARSVSAISVTANMRHVYQVLDQYPQIRAVLSAVAGASVVSRLYISGQ